MLLFLRVSKQKYKEVHGSTDSRATGYLAKAFVLPASMVMNKHERLEWRVGAWRM